MTERNPEYEYYDGPKSGSHSPDLIYERFNAQAFVDFARVLGHDGRLNVDKSAEEIGVELTRDHKHPKLTGIEDSFDGQISINEDPIIIYLNPKRSPGITLLTYGHEVGHYFIEKLTKIAKTSYLNRSETEEFCEYFGRQMVVPKEEIANGAEADEQTVLSVVEKYGADPGTALLQLMLAGRLPKTLIVDANWGSLPNSPKISNKVDRRLVCLDCSMGKEHKPPRKIENIARLDFSTQEWAMSLDDECTKVRRWELDSKLAHAAMNQPRLFY